MRVHKSAVFVPVVLWVGGGLIGFGLCSLTEDKPAHQQGNPVGYVHCVIQTYKQNLASDICEGLDTLGQAKWDARNRAEHGWQREPGDVIRLLFGPGAADCWSYTDTHTIVVCYTGEVNIS